jgi:hypothetical protein
VNEGLQVREVLEELDKRAKKDSQSS